MAPTTPTCNAGLRRAAFRFVAALGLAGTALAALPAAAVSYSGRYHTGLHEYIAGTFAWANEDMPRAASLFAQALAFDDGDAALQERTFELALAGGDYALAGRLAKDLARQIPPDTSAVTFLFVEAFKDRDWRRAETLLALLPDAGFDKVLRQVAQGWIATSRGEKEQAQALLAPLLEAPAFESLALEQMAQMALAAGSNDRALALYTKLVDVGPVSVPARLNAAALLARASQNDRAMALLRPRERDPVDGRLTDAATRLRAGQPLPLARPAPADGMASLFVNVASQLTGERLNQLSLTFARLGAYLDPKSPDVWLLLAAMMGDRGQFADADAALGRIGTSAPLALRIDLQKADLLKGQTRPDEAIALLEKIAVGHPLPLIHAQLGDLYRQQERFDAAAAAYSRAIAATQPLNRDDWMLLYLRGVSYERGHQWPHAETDFREALKLQPDEPNVLNYLGYSLLEQRRNLGEAHAMIVKAVEQRPDDGFMIDSRGWSHFIAGRLDDAVRDLEDAVQREPADPSINEHLGDVYWRVGRILEARYRWRAALDLNPGREQAAAIRDKLDIGLDLAQTTTP